MKIKLWVHLSMKKSFLIPLIIILVFAGIPTAFWFLSSKENVDENVQGVRSGSTGVVLKIVSNGGAWDMFKYVCESKEKCLESLESGKKLDVTSGGGIEEQSVAIKYTHEMESQEFMKIFVKPGWGTVERAFNVSLDLDASDVSIEKMNVGNNDFYIILIPMKYLHSEVFDLATFVDY
mgnify:CR=1 FL=1|jgi:hypothetical protein